MKRSLYYATTSSGAIFTFSHKGAEYRLYRRFDDNAKPYYFDFRRTIAGRKKALGCCLRTNDRELAVKRAKARIDEIDQRLANEQFGLVPKPVKPRGPLATLGEVFAAFTTLAGTEAAYNPIQLTRRLVRRGQGQVIKAYCGATEHAAICAAVDAQSTAVLTDLLVQNFARNTLVAVPPNDPHARRQALNSIVSTVDHGRRLFASERLKALTRADGEFKLHLPDLTAFMECPLEKPARLAKTKPARELLLKTFAAAEQLRLTNPNAFVVFKLAFYSMRRGDIARATIHWLQERTFDDDADFHAPAVKRWGLAWVPHKTSRKGPREVFVPIAAEEAQMFRDHWTREQAGREDWERDYLVSGGRHTRPGRHRCAHVLGLVDAWMRALGWTTAHTLHELRALYARMKAAQYAKAYEAGLQRAATDLGHRDKRLTAGTYVGEMSLHADNTVVRYPGATK